MKFVQRIEIPGERRKCERLDIEGDAFEKSGKRFGLTIGRVEKGESKSRVAGQGESVPMKGRNLVNGSATTCFSTTMAMP